MLEDKLREIDYADLTAEPAQPSQYRRLDRVHRSVFPDRPGAGPGHDHHRPVQPHDGEHRYQADYLGAPLQAGCRAPGSRAPTDCSPGLSNRSYWIVMPPRSHIPGFDRAIDWGWLAWITRPVHHSLVALYRYVGNFGLAIMLLTVADQAVAFPVGLSLLQGRWR